MFKRIFFLFVILAVGLLLRVNQLSQRSLWADEFFTFFQSSGHAVKVKHFLSALSQAKEPRLIAAKEIKAFMKNDLRMRIGDVSRGLLEADTHPPLYFWIISFWIRVFGDSAQGVRSFSVCIGLIAILLAYGLGRCLFDEYTAFFCAIFVSVSAFSVRYAQEARSYALVIALGLLASFFLLRLEKENSNRDALGFAIVNALGIYTHYFYIFIACAHFFYFTAAWHKDTPKLNKFYLAFLSSLALVIPWVIAVMQRGYNFDLAEWIFGYPGLKCKFYYLVTGIARYFYIFDLNPTAALLSWIFSWALMIYMAVITFKGAFQKYRRQVLFSLCMFLIPLCGMLFIDLLQNGALLQQERFWAIPFLGFIPLSGYSLSRLFLKKRPLVYLVLTAMVISSFLVSRIQFGPAPKNLTLWINQESKGKKAGVIIYNIRSAVLSQAYYLDDDIYMLPVSNPLQLQEALKLACRSMDKVFLARYYHRTDSILMDQPFMEIQDIGEGFRLKTSLKRDDISVTEFVRQAAN